MDDEKLRAEKRINEAIGTTTKRKPREWWLVKDPLGATRVTDRPDIARDVYAQWDGYEIIHVREVLKPRSRK